eukprot:15461698-Alexandrium_andersonii.AAC.1
MGTSRHPSAGRERAGRQDLPQRVRAHLDQCRCHMVSLPTPLGRLERAMLGLGPRAHISADCAGCGVGGCGFR